ncbi:hypothetical protein M409DRAFT_29734 [Zasmidium cellare ATCC 36951]|uniref:Peptidase S8/S53 domain-containing protein n=1 Tax=Zasmidium cellare ATCC 36951 TaxID=1080233 RepID=A0A6A6C1N4_ZASCE|nr:uncharacterized protein M409DRAFT_29734 [Zasmidium cellare ATCC 36951]KAF2159732.1 hypothetical protein M409DRAFT_29734 [Zasmidium cellare ATCC 36951]
MRLCSVSLILNFVVHGSWASLPHQTPDDRRTVPAPLICENFTDTASDIYKVKFHANHTLEGHVRHTGINVTTFERFLETTVPLGYIAKIDRDTLDNFIRLDPGVIEVICDRYVSITFSPLLGDSNFESNATQHLDKRWSITTKRGSASYALQMMASGHKISTPVNDMGDYDFLDTAVQGVDIYVLDGGVCLAHSTFGGRASKIRGLAPTDPNPYGPGDMQDTVGHGTAVASFAAGDTTGIAPFARIISIKIDPSNFTEGSVVQAIQDMISNHRSKFTTAGFRGSVLNMSFILFYSFQDINDALNDAAAAGISMFSASGNQGADLDQHPVWPCTLANVNCIGGTDNNYTFWPSTNRGRDVAFLAPAKDVYVALPGSPNNFGFRSGTSLATPLTSGTAAIFTSWLGLANNQAQAYVRSNVQVNFISGVPVGGAGYFVNTAINDVWKNADEPFRRAGNMPHQGLPTANVFNAESNGFCCDQPPVVPPEGPSDRPVTLTPIPDSTTIETVATPTNTKDSTLNDNWTIATATTTASS